MKPFINAIVLAASLANFAFAQQSSLAGRIFDRTDGQPLEFATVSLFAATDSSLVAGAVSDSSGGFYFGRLRAGNYYLQLRFMGYNSKTMPNINLAKNQSLRLGKIGMTANEQLLNELNVTGEASTAYHRIDRRRFKATDFENAQGGTAFDLVLNLPSVNGGADGSLRLRGAAGFTLLLNGKPVQIDAQTMLRQLPANSVQDIELITAPSARFDPDGKGGIINIITQKGAEDGLFVLINTRIGLPSIELYDNAEKPVRYGGDFTLNYRADKWDISLGMSYLRDDLTGRREGYVSTLLNDTLTEFPSSGERSYERFNYSGRLTLGYQVTAKGRLSAAFYGGKRRQLRTADILYDQQRTLGGNPDPISSLAYFNANLVERTGDFWIGSMDYEQDLGNGWSGVASVLYEYTELGGPSRNINVGFPATGDTLQHQRNRNDNPLNGLRMNLDFRKKWGNGPLLEWGYQFRHLLHTGDFAFEQRVLGSNAWEPIPLFSNSVDLERHIHGIYGQLSGTVGKLDYTTGLRYEYANRLLTTGQEANTRNLTLNSFFPTANLLFRITESTHLKSAYSRRIARTTTFKMNPFPEREHSETLEQGDPNLLPEFIDLGELGWVQYFGSSSLSLTGYFRATRDVINRVNTVFNDTILNRIYTNAGNARTWGMELTTELNPTDWFKFFAGANLYSYRLDGQLFGQEVSTAQPVFSLNTQATFNLPAQTSVQLTFNYLSERVTAQGEDSRFYNPSLVVRKSFLNGRLDASLQWLNMDMGLLKSNEQRITTRQPNFFTTTNYIYEVDVLLLVFSYRIKGNSRKVDFIKSEFGDQEF